MNEAHPDAIRQYWVRVRQAVGVDRTWPPGSRAHKVGVGSGVDVWEGEIPIAAHTAKDAHYQAGLMLEAREWPESDYRITEIYPRNPMRD